MIIDRLKIDDFLIIKSADLDLSDVGLSSITGQWVNDLNRSNGTGKTSFVESIRFALFGKIRSQKKQGVVRKPCKKAKVELHVTAGARKIKIIRSVDRGASSARVWVDGKLSGDKVTVCNDVVKEHLGIDADLFDKIYYFKQRDQFGFTQASPSERKAMLGKVFRMEAVDRCHEEAKKRCKEAQAKVDAQKRAIQFSISDIKIQGPLGTHQTKLDEANDEYCTNKLMFDYCKEFRKTLDDDIKEFDENRAAFDVECASMVHESKRLESLIQRATHDIVEYQVELQQAESTYQSINSQKKDCQKLVDSAPDLPSLSTLQANKKRLSESQNNHRAVRAGVLAEIAAQDKIASIADSGGGQCPNCYQVITTEHVESIIASVSAKKQELSQKVDSIDKQIALEGSMLDDIDSKIEKSNEIQGYRSTLEHLTSQLKELTSQRDKRSRKIRELTDERDKYQLEYSGVFDRARIDDSADMLEWLNQFRPKYDEMKSSIDTRIDFYQLKMNDAQKDISLIEKDMVGIENLMRRKKALEDELATMEFDLDVYSRLVDAFGKGGIQALMIENAVGLIEQFTNEMLQMIGSRFLINMNTQKATSDGALGETLDISVSSNGIEMPFENYSGGEQTIINLSMRLALSRVIGSLHGVRLQSLFMDEVLAELDDVSRSDAMRILSYLSKSFDQVFVISHTNEVKDTIQSNIHIRRYDDHSEIKIQNDGRNEAA